MPQPNASNAFAYTNNPETLEGVCIIQFTRKVLKKKLEEKLLFHIFKSKTFFVTELLNKDEAIAEGDVKMPVSNNLILPLLNQSWNICQRETLNIML